ncbi:hypothetical protein [Listeria booriae]|uniref:hypothetical protein n=1 Tax=Listeria booriae TaxID=1552123 RepID=UPI00162508D3|nr:hypothetical protein [Listeria booriae]MBC2676237.1 hypothetical protein [Listeria booriae]MBC6151049.1 hypothetical protein [Listeria booriae]MBC6151202.1 hypothetical protein [Listeria booriae]
MKVDSTLTFALILSVCAIFVPTIGSYISKRFDLKMKELEFKKDLSVNNYSTVLTAFQEFTVASGAVLSRIDLKEMPSRNELQTFESACLKCLLFLDEEDRNQFQKFRVLVKIKFGHTDPRGTGPYLFHMDFIQSAMLKSLGGTPPDATYSAFNRCVSIAHRHIGELLTQKL